MKKKWTKHILCLWSTQTWDILSRFEYIKKLTWRLFSQESVRSLSVLTLKLGLRFVYLWGWLVTMQLIWETILVPCAQDLVFSKVWWMETESSSAHGWIWLICKVRTCVLCVDVNTWWPVFGFLKHQGLNSKSSSIIINFNEYSIDQSWSLLTVSIFVALIVEMKTVQQRLVLLQFKWRCCDNWVYERGISSAHDRWTDNKKSKPVWRLKMLRSKHSN